jgi:hypothetical protein
MSMFWRRADGALIHSPSSLVLSESQWTRRGRRVAGWIGKWLPSVLSTGGIMGLGALIFIAGEAIGSGLGFDNGFREGCTASVGGGSTPCDWARKAQRLRFEGEVTLPQVPAAVKAKRLGEADDLCRELVKFPAPVGLSLARYAECPGVDAP